MKGLFTIFGPVFLLFSFLPGSGQDLDRIDSLDLALSVADLPQTQVELSVELAEEYLSNQPHKAEEYALNALQVADRIGHQKGWVAAKRLLADIYQKTSDYKKALRYAAESMEQARESEFLEEQARINGIYGLIFSDLGDYEKSSGYMFESLELYERLGLQKGISKALNGIGYVLFEQEQYDKALDYYAQALAISREIEDAVGISRGLNNVAAVYGVQGNLQRVKKYLIEAVQINQKIGQRFWEGINYMNLGALSLDEKTYDSAFFYYNKAIRIFEDLDHVLQLSRALIGMSNYYLSQDSVAQSELYARKAFVLGKTHKLTKEQSNAANQLKEIFDWKGNPDSAYHYGILHYELKDSLNLEKSITRHSQLELLYEFEKMNQEKRIDEQRKEFTYLILILILVFSMVVGFIIYSNRQKIRSKNLEMTRNQLQTELEEKNRELTYNVMALMKKNEVLSEIAGKLMDVENEAVKDETKSAIRKIARDLQKTGDDEVWKEFEVRFKQVHGDFYEKLLQQYPDLSPNEQKLCAFLRLNLSTKEISELTGQRVSTLEIARSRLRKKLGITNKQVNLVSFLAKM